MMLMQSIFDAFSQLHIERTCDSRKGRKGGRKKGRIRWGVYVYVCACVRADTINAQTAYIDHFRLYDILDSG